MTVLLDFCEYRQMPTTNTVPFQVTVSSIPSAFIVFWACDIGRASANTQHDTKPAG